MRVFKKFQFESEGVELMKILREQEIDSKVEVHDTFGADPLVPNQLDSKYFLKINQEDFPRAIEILKDLAEDQVKSAEENHYLYSFSDTELYDLLLKQDEWSEFDVELSKKILKERGKEVDAHVIERLNERRIEELAKQENPGVWVLAGYIFALLGGLIGIFIGWYLAYHERTLPNGEKAPAFAKDVQERGKEILYIGIPMFFIWIIIRVFFL